MDKQVIFRNIYLYIDMHIIATREKREHGFKIEQERIYRMAWTEEKEGRNGVIILYNVKNQRKK